MTLFKPTAKIRGFGLVEVLIAALILSIGLLGLVALQNRAMKTAQEGDNIITAAVIAQEVVKRMLSNPYRTSLGKQGYLATDLHGDIPASGGLQDWSNNVLGSYFGIDGCYALYSNESCAVPEADINDSTEHQTALLNMQMMDEVELRLWAASALPNGQIRMCFDNTQLDASLACDDTAVRSAYFPENQFTVKVGWTDVVDGSERIYVLQFIAECTDPDTLYCG